ncbi:hypothetical protein LZQ00_12280 [Sphingobacterium sp. SRCM116780]|uniref:hypothetical protein n=1 Tax=Sphingobacterium sp. SRCM116780 TaxID=2907623 RepID=UPI001F35D7A1|nr:hypothetical protein [Sphingobacterium sp. SRCM116780]UIR55056.1 hypothetical protein LZQ00_12280 [Sphingobacterium sp. SRCM116780]
MEINILIENSIIFFNLVQEQGWANFQAKGIWEQIVVAIFMGIVPYETERKNGAPYNEFDAEQKRLEIQR